MRVWLRHFHPPSAVSRPRLDRVRSETQGWLKPAAFLVQTWPQYCSSVSSGTCPTEAAPPPPNACRTPTPNATPGEMPPKPSPQISLRRLCETQYCQSCKTQDHFKKGGPYSGLLAAVSTRPRACVNEHRYLVPAAHAPLHPCRIVKRSGLRALTKGALRVHSLWRKRHHHRAHRLRRRHRLSSATRDGHIPKHCRRPRAVQAAVVSGHRAVRISGRQLNFNCRVPQPRPPVHRPVLERVAGPDGAAEHQQHLGQHDRPSEPPAEPDPANHPSRLPAEPGEGVGGVVSQGDPRRDSDAGPFAASTALRLRNRPWTSTRPPCGTSRAPSEASSVGRTSEWRSPTTGSSPASMVSSSWARLRIRQHRFPSSRQTVTQCCRT